jgi:fructokinase
MRLKNKNILCFGEMLWDRLPSGSKPGGAPMNVALHLKRFGLSPWFASRVGDDDAGRELIAFLKNNKLKTGLIQRGKTLPTGEVQVKLDSKGNATYRICEPVAWDNIAFNHKLAERAAEMTVFVFGSLAARNEITRNTLLQLLNTSAYRILDVNLRPPFHERETVELLLSKSDFAKMNHDELEIIAGWHKLTWQTEEEKAREITTHYGLSGVCITRGEKGAAILSGGEWIENNGFKVEVADTVGAGDAFLAALIYAFTEKKSPEEALSMACATGAFVASKEGATPEYSYDDIQNMISLQ